MKRYFYNLFIAIDQLGNVLLGGSPDETISSRVGRTRHEKKISDLTCEVLDVLDPDHCETSIERDEAGNPKARHL